VVAVAAAVTLAAVGHGRAESSSAPLFATSVVQAAHRHGEPSVAVDGQYVYVATPTGGPGVSGDVLYRSIDGGATFSAHPLGTGGSGDSDVAVDGDGVVYVSDLFGAPGKLLPVSTSLDHGETFVRTVGSAATGSFDRQWTAAEGHGHVVNVVHGNGFRAFVSRDQAQTFTEHVVDINGDMPGPPVFSPDKSIVYAPYDAGNDLRLGRSSDGGDTWTSTHIATLGEDVLGFNTLDFPVAAVDAAGTVYVAWVTGNSLLTTDPVWMAKSTDSGATWSTPVAVSAPTGSVVMPWIAAGAPGHIAIAYYQVFMQLGDRGPELGLADATWDVALAESFDADSATPSFSHSTIAANVHRGSICTSGTGCAGPKTFGYVNAPLPFDRQVLDFFEIALDADGNVFATYPVDRPLYGRNGGLDDVIYTNADLILARQASGAPL
jgi:hypothetical protein